MAIRLFQRKKRIINIMLTDYAIRFVEVAPGRPVKVEQYGERLIPPGIIKKGDIIDRNQLLAIMENCVDEWKIKSRPVRFLVPDSFIAMKEEKVELDLEDDEINAYLFMKIGTSIHLPFENPVFDTAVTQIEEGKKHILLIAAPEEKVEEYVGVFEKSSLTPIAADVGPLNLYRLYYEMDLVQENAHHVLLHLKQGSLTISIFHRHQPKFMKPVSFEANEDTIDILSGEKNELDEFMDVFSELDKVINFYENSLHKGNVRISSIFLNGDFTRADLFKQSLKDRYNLLVYGDEVVDIKVNDGGSLPAGFFSIVGLGLKEG